MHLRSHACAGLVRGARAHARVHDQGVYHMLIHVARHACGRAAGADGAGCGVLWTSECACVGVCMHTCMQACMHACNCVCNIQNNDALLRGVHADDPHMTRVHIHNADACAGCCDGATYAQTPAMASMAALLDQCAPAGFSGGERGSGAEEADPGMGKQPPAFDAANDRSMMAKIGRASLVHSNLPPVTDELTKMQQVCQSCEITCECVCVRMHAGVHACMHAYPCMNGRTGGRTDMDLCMHTHRPRPRRSSAKAARPAPRALNYTLSPN